MISNETLQSNLARLLGTTEANQLVGSNQTNEISSKLVTSKKSLEEILKDISNKINYIINLGQMLWVIFDIKCYIFNLVPSKPISLKPIVALVVIDP
jgi:hypothetical protein